MVWEPKNFENAWHRRLFMHKETHEVWVLRLWNNPQCIQVLVSVPSLFEWVSSIPVMLHILQVDKLYIGVCICSFIHYFISICIIGELLMIGAPMHVFFKGRFTPTHEWGASWILKVVLGQESWQSVQIGFRLLYTAYGLRKTR